MCSWCNDTGRVGSGYMEQDCACQNSEETCKACELPLSDCNEYGDCSKDEQENGFQWLCADYNPQA